MSLSCFRWLWLGLKHLYATCRRLTSQHCVWICRGYSYLICMHEVLRCCVFLFQPSTYTPTLHEANSDACDTDRWIVRQLGFVGELGPWHCARLIAHHHSRPVAPTAGNSSPTVGGSQQRQSLPSGYDCNFGAHPCVCATTRSSQHWPGLRLLRHDGQPPPTDVGNNPALAQTRWVNRDSLSDLGGDVWPKNQSDDLGLPIHRPGVTDSYYRTNSVLVRGNGAERQGWLQSAPPV